MCVRENVCVCVSDVSERVNEWVNERVSEGQSREELDESGYDFGADVYCWMNKVPSRQESVPVSSDLWTDPLPVIVKGVTPKGHRPWRDVSPVLPDYGLRAWKQERCNIGDHEGTLSRKRKGSGEQRKNGEINRRS